MTDFPLADWEYFRHPVNADGDEAWIEFIRVIDTPTGARRILGWGEMVDVEAPAAEVWLHPDRVPTRVLRGDCAWPRIHPLEARKMCQRVEPEPEDVAEVVIPEPELRARPAALEEIPRGARLTGRRAARAGFRQRATLARGPRLNQYWRPVETSDSLRIDGVHPDGRWFTAHWITKTGQRGKKAGVTEWSFDFAYVLKSGELTACNSSQLDEYFDH